MAITRECCKKLAHKLSQRDPIWQALCKCGAIIKKGRSRFDINLPGGKGFEIEEEIINNYYLVAWKDLQRRPSAGIRGAHNKR